MTGPLRIPDRPPRNSGGSREESPERSSQLATRVSGEGMESLIEPTIGRWFTAPFREQRKDVVDPVRTRIRTTDPRGYAGCCHAISTLDLTDKLSAIKLPTVVIVGEEDQGTPVAVSQAIQAKIAGSQLEIIKSAAHRSNLEQPEAFTRIITSFLPRFLPGSAKATGRPST